MTETEAIRENYNLGVLAGEARERQRIIKLLHDKAAIGWIEALEYPYYAEELEELITAEDE